MRQTRRNRPAAEPIRQMAFNAEDAVWICPYCSNTLVRIGSMVPDRCPECGQRIEMGDNT